MTARPQTPHAANRGYRAAGAILGLLFLASGLYVALTASADWLALATAAALAILGCNLLYAACMGRTSWLGKLGPLP